MSPYARFEEAGSEVWSPNARFEGAISELRKPECPLELPLLGTLGCGGAKVLGEAILS